MKVNELNIPFLKQCKSGNFLLPAGSCVHVSGETTLPIAVEAARPDVTRKIFVLIKTSNNSF
jgi:hypothetical protein